MDIIGNFGEEKGETNYESNREIYAFSRDPLQGAAGAAARCSYCGSEASDEVVRFLQAFLLTASIRGRQQLCGEPKKMFRAMRVLSKDESCLNVSMPNRIHCRKKCGVCNAFSAGGRGHRIHFPRAKYSVTPTGSQSTFPFPGA